MRQRLTDDKAFEEEMKSGIDSIRPTALDDFIGQKPVIDKLKIYIKAAKERGEALDHVLFYGPPGLGKTTLGSIIANELAVSFESTAGPALERPGDLAAILTNIRGKGVLFIDEIHRLNHIIEEKLYPAMEDFHLDLVVGQGPSARIISLNLEPFTLIGATTRFGALTAPLRDRFGVICRLDYYTPDEILLILERSSYILKITANKQGLFEIATRARGTPRIANRLLRRVRDYAQVERDGLITREVAASALELMEIDGFGLDSTDRKLLEIMIKHYSGGPVGVETLAVALSESKETVEDVYEPYLIKTGFIKRTSRGRIVTAKAYEHLHLPYDVQTQLQLPFD